WRSQQPRPPASAAGSGWARVRARAVVWARGPAPARGRTVARVRAQLRLRAEAPLPPPAPVRPRARGSKCARGPAGPSRSPLASAGEAPRVEAVPWRPIRRPGPIRLQRPARSWRGRARRGSWAKAAGAARRQALEAAGAVRVGVMEAGAAAEEPARRIVPV